MRTRWVVALLLLIPLADAALLVVVAGRFGWPATVAFVVLTGLLGTLLVRAEGRHTLRKMQRTVGAGEVPTGELLDGALLLVAGAFLLTPGVVTDALGFLLALPPTRYPIRELLRRRVVVPYLDAHTGGFATGRVWTAGFPDEGDDAAGDRGTGATYDVDPDDYRFDDGGDGPPKGNA